MDNSSRQNWTGEINAPLRRARPHRHHDADPALRPALHALIASAHPGGAPIAPLRPRSPRPPATTSLPTFANITNLGNLAGLFAQRGCLLRQRDRGSELRYCNAKNRDQHL